MPSLSLNQVATAAAQYLGVLYSGESLSAQQLTDALNAANAMLDNWNSQRLLIPRADLETFSLVSGTQSYTIGPALTFAVTPAPVKIEAAHLFITSGPSFPIEVVSAEQWARIIDRQSSSYLVKYLFYDRGAATGTGRVYFSPIPLGGTVQLTLWVPLTQFPDVSTAITILPGYSRLIELALAIELAPQYNLAPTPTLMTNYQQALTNVGQLNADLFGSGGSSMAPIAPSQPVGTA